MNSLPNTVIRQRRGCDLNPGPSAPESSTLTTRLASHPFAQWTRLIPGPVGDGSFRGRGGGGQVTGEVVLATPGGDHVQYARMCLIARAVDSYEMLIDAAVIFPPPPTTNVLMPH